MTVVSPIRWNDKARTYLSKLLYIDGRNGKTRQRLHPSGISLNRFVNMAIITICETNKHSLTHIADAKDLELALKRFRVKKIQEQREELRKQLEEITGTECE